MEFLRFTFQNIYHFVGVLILLSVVGEVIIKVAHALRSPRE